MTYQLHKNRQAKTLDLELFQGKCMHLYHYWYDAYFGFMGARIQTWFPFAIPACRLPAGRQGRQADADERPRMAGPQDGSGTLGLPTL
jgi:hypothetical protein